MPISPKKEYLRQLVSKLILADNYILLEKQMAPKPTTMPLLAAPRFVPSSVSIWLMFGNCNADYCLGILRA